MENGSSHGEENKWNETTRSINLPIAITITDASKIASHSNSWDARSTRKSIAETNEQKVTARIGK